MQPIVIQPKNSAELKFISELLGKLGIRFTALSEELAEDIGLDAASDIDIPEWQKNIVRERMAEYKADPTIAIPWKEARKQIKTKK